MCNEKELFIFPQEMMINDTKTPREYSKMQTSKC